MADLSPAEERTELLEAVLSMRDEVRALNEKLAFYAPRDEVKKTFRSGALRLLALAAVVILVSQMLTMTMISTCFLNANGEARAACSLMPGYGQATKQNEIRLARFDLLLDGLEKNTTTSLENQRRVDALEKRLSELEKGQGGN